MKLARSVPLAAALLPCAAIPVVAQEKSVERQIAEAVSPLPETLRRGAAVLGYGDGDRDGRMVVLREGTNTMICLADDPMREGFHTACYHESLGPFMARGRELRAQGKDGGERRAIRIAEIEAGTLTMPDHPAALYSLTGEEGIFDPATGTAPGAAGLYVVYVAYATEESSGISARPAAERPWLMGAGTAWAHIMYRR